MIGPAWLDWVFASLLALMSLYHAARLITAERSAADLAHLLMGVGMIAMFLPGADPLPRLVWVGAFVAAGAWFVAYLLRGKRDVDLAHLVVGNAAMLYMLAFTQAAAPEPGPAVALAASGGLAHVHGAGGGGLLAPLGPVLAGYFAVHALWSAGRAVRRRAPWLAAGGHTVMGLSMAYMLVPPLT